MTRRLMIFFLFGVLLFLAPALLFGGEGQGISEPFENGWIDWSDSTVWANGTHAPNAMGGEAASPEAREHYINRAEQNAKDHLSSMLRALTIHGDTTGADALANNRENLAQIDLMFLSTPVVKKRFLTDGSVEVILRFPLKGAFSQLILPEEIHQIDPIKPLFTSRTTPKEEAAVSYTGLIVDARGINIKPGLAPRVVTETGDEVYGPTMISREYAVQRGVAAYERTLTQASIRRFMGENPLVVTGIGTTALSHTDIIISSEDAARIRSDAGHTLFLSQCRVIIVMDLPGPQKNTL